MRNSDRNIHLEFCSLHKVINNSQEACRFVGCSQRKTQTTAKKQCVEVCSLLCLEKSSALFIQNSRFEYIFFCGCK